MSSRDEDSNGPSHDRGAGTQVPEPELRSTEEQMNMQGTIPPRVDRKGSKIEDAAGTGDLGVSGG